MSENTNIAWCDATFNPWIGCSKVSPACDNCYAERFGRRVAVHWGAGQARVRTKTWGDPVRWNKHEFVQCPMCGWRGEWRAADALHGCCPACGHLPQLFTRTRRRVFCASLADVFDNEVDPQWRADLFELIRLTPNLDWLLLTKRIGNVGNMLPVPFDFERMYTNVWLGATVCNQAEADRDIPKLLAIPAARRFLSIEPMLGPIDMSRWLPAMRWAKRATTGEPFQVPHYYMAHCLSCGWMGTSERLLYVSNGDDGECYCPECDRLAEDKIDGLDWIICGGESGPQARPMHPAWPHQLRDQCASAGVPFFMKQMGGVRDKRGAINDLPEDLQAREFPV